MSGIQSLSSTWPLVGRETELDAIGRAVSGRGVVIGAEAGAGKSRLARQVFASVQQEGVLAEWVQATRSAATLPLAAFAGLIPETVRADDMVVLMRRSTEALQERAAGRPVLLAVDDAQMLDPVSAALVLHLSTAADVRVLATVRSGEPCPDAITALWKDAGVARFELGALTDDAARTLVERVLDGALDEATARWLLDRARGNPLLLRELTVGAIESGALALQAGLWRLSGPVPPTGTLRDLVQEHVHRVAEDARRVVELLALSEPLLVAELTDLVSLDAVVDADAHGLVAVDGEEVRVSHPLFGEVVVAALPTLRGRALRVAMAERLEQRRPVTDADALRIARLRLDAGVGVSGRLALIAARAANLSGDPHLGAQLAQQAVQDGAGLAAVMVLARAHSMSNRHAEAEAALAEGEPLAPGHPDANEYLWQRIWALLWPLGEAEAAAALVERAAGWPGGADWEQRVEQARRHVSSTSRWFTDGTASALGGLDGRMRVVTEITELVWHGEGDAGAERAGELSPPIPLRDTTDSAALGTRIMTTILTGNAWSETEDYLRDLLPQAIRAGDREASGLAAGALALLAFERGRYRESARWMAEADPHLSEQDLIGRLVHMRAIRVGVAASTNNPSAAVAALERMEAALGGRDPSPIQRMHVIRARGWVAAARSRAEALTIMRAGADLMAEPMPVHAAHLAYEALRLGANVADELEALAKRGETRIVAAFAAHARARAGHDGGALLAAADELSAIGANHYAMEAAVDAATAFRNAGREDSARRAATRARELHSWLQDVPPPALEGPVVELTPRERQLTELAASGLSNPEIAERLVLSVRTVEAHLYSAMRKLGVSSRQEL